MIRFSPYFEQDVLQQDDDETVILPDPSEKFEELLTRYVDLLHYVCQLDRHVIVWILILLIY